MKVTLLIPAVSVFITASCGIISTRADHDPNELTPPVKTANASTPQVDPSSIQQAQKQQFEMPKVGDTWKYKILRGGYRTAVVTQLIDKHSFALKVTTTRGKSTSTEWKSIAFERDATTPGSILIVDVPVYKNDLEAQAANASGRGGMEVLLRTPLRLKDTWMNEKNSGYTRMVEFDEVAHLADSVKVIAGTFNKVWTIHRMTRVDGQDDSVDEYFLYAEGVGLIELLSRGADGNLETVLELASYKMNQKRSR
jgi:hypothetical protein